jgi:hypothetical protein
MNSSVIHGKIGKLLITTQHNNPPSHENDDAYVIYWTPLTPQVQNAIYFGIAYGDRRTPKTEELHHHRPPTPPKNPNILNNF